MNNIEKRNVAAFVLGESLWGFQMHMVAPATVLTVLLLKFNTDESWLGIVSAAEGLILLPQIVGVFLFKSKRRLKQNIVYYHIFGITPFIFLMGVTVLYSEHLSAESVRYLLLASFAATLFMIGVVISVWIDWLAHVFKPSHRGTIMGATFCCASILGAVASVLAGWLIQRFAGVDVYGWLYIAAGVIAVLSMLVFLIVDDGYAEAGEEERVSMKKFTDHFKLSVVNKQVQFFLFGRILQIAGLCIVPFVAAFFKSGPGGGLSSSEVVTCGAGMTVGIALFHITMGWIGDKRGHLLGLIVGVLAQIIALSLMLFAGGIIVCWGVYFFIGVSVGSGFLSHTNLLIDICPHDFRLGHITAGNLVLCAPIFVLPILGGVGVKLFGLQTLFMVCLIISILSLLWFLFKVQDPRSQKALPKCN